MPKNLSLLLRGPALNLKNTKIILESYSLRRRKKMMYLLRIIALHPGGISTKEIVRQSYGSVHSSLRLYELEQARLNAARKQLQRANEFLKKCNSCSVVIYCKERKVWILKEAI
jgi:hypothetical protein